MRLFLLLVGVCIRLVSDSLVVGVGTHQASVKDFIDYNSPKFKLNIIIETNKITRKAEERFEPTTKAVLSRWWIR